VSELLSIVLVLCFLDYLHFLNGKDLKEALNHIDN